MQCIISKWSKKLGVERWMLYTRKWLTVRASINIRWLAIVLPAMAAPYIWALTLWCALRLRGIKCCCLALFSLKRQEKRRKGGLKKNHHVPLSTNEQCVILDNITHEHHTISVLYFSTPVMVCDLGHSVSLRAC